MTWTKTNGVDNPVPDAKAGEFWVRYDGKEVLSLHDSDYWCWDNTSIHLKEIPMLQITHYRMDSDVSTI